MKQRIMRYVGSLRFPFVLALTGVLLAINVLVPDPVPFVDEALLALIAIILSRLKRGGSNDSPASSKDVNEKPE